MLVAGHPLDQPTGTVVAVLGPLPVDVRSHQLAGVVIAVVDVPPAAAQRRAVACHVVGQLQSVAFVPVFRARATRLLSSSSSA